MAPFRPGQGRNGASGHEFHVFHLGHPAAQYFLHAQDQRHERGRTGAAAAPQAETRHWASVEALGERVDASMALTIFRNVTKAAEEDRALLREGKPVRQGQVLGPQSFHRCLLDELGLSESFVAAAGYERLTTDEYVLPHVRDMHVYVDPETRT